MAKKRISIGIDLGNDTVKIVSLERDGGSYSLSSVGMFSYGGDREKLKTFMSGVKFKSKDVRINMDDPSLKIRRLDLPIMPAEEVPEAAKWGLKDTIDGEVEEFSFRQLAIDPVNVTVDKKMPLIMFAVRNKAVEDLYQLLKDLTVPRPKVIEPNASALANIFDHSKGDVRENFSVLINMGRLQALFTVMGKKGLVYSRPLSGCSEKSLIDQVARDEGLSHDDAEKAVRSPEEQKVQGTVSRFFSNVAIDIQRSIDGFSMMFNKAPISNIYFCGRAVHYAQILPNVSTALNIPVSLFDPFEKIDTSLFQGGKFDDIRPTFAIACGLAVD